MARDGGELARVARKLRARADAINGAAFLMPWATHGYPGIDCDAGATTLAARVACFGAVEPLVAGAAVAPIEPRDAARRIAGVWRVTTPTELLALRAAGATAFIRAAVADRPRAIDDIERAAELLCPALDTTPPDGHLIFAALQVLPWPDDVVTRLWRASDMVRERRGASHIAAATAHGLDSVHLCVLSDAWRGTSKVSVTGTWPKEARDAARADLAGRGWLDADGAITPTGLAVREALEDATDRGEAVLVEALGAGAEALFALLTPLAQRVLEFAQNAQ